MLPMQPNATPPPSPTHQRLAHHSPIELDIKRQELTIQITPTIIAVVNRLPH